MKHCYLFYSKHFLNRMNKSYKVSTVYIYTGTLLSPDFRCCMDGFCVVKFPLLLTLYTRVSELALSVVCVGITLGQIPVMDCA